MTDHPMVPGRRSPNTQRFVVLLHTIGSGFVRTDGDHYDWMFQHGHRLRTWAVDKQTLDPVSWIGHASSERRVEVACQALPDHREAYLDYEGPVSRQRGEVRRVLSGKYQLVVDTPDVFEAVLDIDESGSINIAQEDTATLLVRFYRSVVSDATAPGNSNWCLELFSG